MTMKRTNWVLLLAFPLALAGCEAMTKVTSMIGGEEPVAEAEAENPQEKYVTLNVKDRWGFRIKEPMGSRTTGGNCAIWKDEEKDSKGRCCWNQRGECSCPCPERVEE